MHYANLVIVDKEEATKDLEKSIEKSMGAHEDQGGFWDWYQIGGRWTGALTDYEPEKDPKNQENGKAKWPTEWVRYEGDVSPIENLTQEQLDKFFRVVTPWAKTYGGEEYIPWLEVPDCFRRKERPPLEWLKKEYEGHLIVVVDNHS